MPPGLDLQNGDLPGPAAAAGEGDATRAVVCKGLRCLPPLDSLAALKEELENRDDHQD